MHMNYFSITAGAMSSLAEEQNQGLSCRGRTMHWALLVLASVVMCALARDLPAEEANALLQQGEFIQIPGPNPILTTGEPGSWDSWLTEAADIIEDLGTYYLYYHGAKDNETWYELGVATSSHPLGPFVKHGDRPIIPHGPPGSWDAAGTFCALVVKKTSFDNTTKSKYYMLYGAPSVDPGPDPTVNVCDIGLATADHPLGPWKKFSGNPVIKDFGYNGGIVERDGKWYLYNAWPVSSASGRDYSNMSLATADKLEGPWTKYEGNPILKKGGWGTWDDGGFSESGVFSTGDYFHMFYGGAKPTDPRMLSRESIGYAYSRDGIHWVKHGRNPVATHQADPNAAAFAEVRALWEPPFVYCYHTLRYEKPWRPGDEEKFPDVEDLGVQVIATQRPFAIDMPVLSRPELAAGESTSLSTMESRAIALSNVTSAALTVKCRFSEDAKSGLRVHVRSSTDGENFDTEDLASFEMPVSPGAAACQTFPVAPNVRFIKVVLENTDESQPVEDIDVQATLRG